MMPQDSVEPAVIRFIVNVYQVQMALCTTTNLFMFFHHLGSYVLALEDACNLSCKAAIYLEFMNALTKY